jgi:NAD-dependent SIR2 family protein deacetylase
LIQCHGSFASASCIKCHYQVEGQVIFDDVKAGRVPKCPRCLINESSNGSKKRKRGVGQNEGKRKRSTDDSTDDDAYDIPEPGVMKVGFSSLILPAQLHMMNSHHSHLPKTSILSAHDPTKLTE